MPRRAPALVTVLVVLAGCSATPSVSPSSSPTGGSTAIAPTAPATPAASVATSPVASPDAVGGGCGTTQFFSGHGPDSALGLDGNPWARAQPTSAGFVAYMWAPPPDLLVASGPDDPGSKVLWINTVVPSGRLAITAHPAGAPSPTATFHIDPASAPDGNYPSIIDLPTPGCWHLELDLSGAHGALDVRVAPAPPSPAPSPSPSR